MKPIKTPTLWEDLQYPAVILGISLLLLLTLKNTFNSVVLLSDQHLVEAEKKRQSGWLDLIHYWIDWSLLEKKNNNQSSSPSVVAAVPMTHTSEAVVAEQPKAVPTVPVNSASSPLPSPLPGAPMMPGAPTQYTQVPKNLQASVDELFHPAMAQPFKASELQGEVLIEGGNLSVSLQWEPRDDQASSGGGVLAVDEIAVERAVMSGDSGLFTYEQEGQSYSGSIFSSGAPGGYILSFENGPYQGVRLQFKASGSPANEVNEGHDDTAIEFKEPSDRELAQEDNIDSNIANVQETANLAEMAKQLANDYGDHNLEP